MWADKLATEVESQLQTDQPRNAFKNIRRLRGQGLNVSAPIQAADGSVLSDNRAKLTRWNEYFSGLLNKPVLLVPESLQEAASSATPDPSVLIDAPSLQEVRDAVGKLKAGKAAGCCCINTEMLKHGGEVMLEKPHDLFTGVCWDSEAVPADRRKGIILPLHKGRAVDRNAATKGL